MLTPVADALCRAHRLPTSEGIVTVVHRDLKPENIFLANVLGKKLTKVLDFGIAKVKSAATQVVGKQSANESPLAGFTPAYGSPEQWLPKRYGQTGPWTDVWGLALTAVEALCGHAPFDGEQAAMMMQALDTERRPTPRNEGARVSDRVEAIFAKALAVDPRDRYAEVGPFWNDLCAAIGLPQVVGDHSPSLAPPPDVAAPVAVATVDSRSQPTLIDRSAVAVPDLVAPRGKPGPGTSAAARLKPADPAGALFGATLEAPDDAGPALRLETGAPVASRGQRLALDAPLSMSRPLAARAAPRLVRPGSVGRKLDLGAPLKLFGVAIAMMAGDYAYSVVTGEALRFGPARVFWAAGPLAAIGAILLLSRLLGAED
jgi:serine/threonine-protein kinase